MKTTYIVLLIFALLSVSVYAVSEVSVIKTGIFNDENIGQIKVDNNKISDILENE